MNNKPDLAHGIYRVTHIIRVGDKLNTAESDLIIMNGEPFVVLEWEGRRESQYPKLKLPLDPTQISPPDQRGYCVYSGPPLVDPRPVH